MKILGYPDQETMLAANIKDLYLDGSIREQELALIEQGDVVSNHRMQLRRYDNAVIWVQDSASAVRDSSGQTVHYYGRLEDITERVWTEMELQRANKQLQTHLAEIKELEAALREQATRDPLTGVFNRRYMDEVLQQELARAARKGGALSVVILDLDHLKEINDAYGHVAGGDKALQTLADTLKQMCRAEDTLCRYGGDEFLVILHDTPAQVACERAMQWKEAVAKIKFSSSDMEFRVTFSAGIATFSSQSSTGEDILIHADSALYRAKELGRDQVVIYQQGSST
jgi:diguanylate cyclase (GGDEF)-like protein/PAS domain S-box-containing protein